MPVMAQVQLCAMLELHPTVLTGKSILVSLKLQKEICRSMSATMSM